MIPGNPINARLIGGWVIYNFDTARGHAIAVIDVDTLVVIPTDVTKLTPAETYMAAIREPNNKVFVFEAVTVARNKVMLAHVHTAMYRYAVRYFTSKGKDDKPEINHARLLQSVVEQEMFSQQNIAKQFIKLDPAVIESVPVYVRHTKYETDKEILRFGYALVEGDAYVFGYLNDDEALRACDPLFYNDNQLKMFFDKAGKTSYTSRGVLSPSDRLDFRWSYLSIDEHEIARERLGDWSLDRYDIQYTYPGKYHELDNPYALFFGVFSQQNIITSFTLELGIVKAFIPFYAHISDEEIYKLLEKYVIDKNVNELFSGPAEGLMRHMLESLYHRAEYAWCDDESSLKGTLDAAVKRNKLDRPYSEEKHEEPDLLEGYVVDYLDRVMPIDPSMELETWSVQVLVDYPMALPLGKTYSLVLLNNIGKIRVLDTFKWHIDFDSLTLPALLVLLTQEACTPERRALPCNFVSDKDIVLLGAHLQ